MEASLVIAIYHYHGQFYLPTCVRSIDGLFGVTDPIVVVAADDRAALAEEIELKAVAGNPTVSRADFRAASDRKLLAAMHLPSLLAFYTKVQRWHITECDGRYTLIPFKPAAIRGVVEDAEHAVTLTPATFVGEAIDLMEAQRQPTS